MDFLRTEIYHSKTKGRLRRWVTGVVWDLSKGFEETKESESGGGWG